MKLPALSALFLSIFSLSHICVSAQMLSVSASQINFGDAYALERDSQQITLSNNFATAINVLEIHISNPVFSTPVTQFEIPANSSHNITVYFAPRHNVNYKAGLIILCEGKQGNLALNLSGQGKYKDAYYASTENLWEEELKAALKTLLAKNYASLGYNGARDRMYMDIDNQKVNGIGTGTNTLECVYTGRLAQGYTSRADAQTNYNFNTEHTFPQGFFDQNEPMRSDLHHLFPTDETANSRRSNYPFGVVNNPTWEVGGSKGQTGFFEPRDEHKGNAARALFYFVTRYQDYSNHVKVQEEILRKWLTLDSVDAVERQRNDDIFSYQKNRNPLVDHPEFAERITSFSSTFIPREDFSYTLPLSKITFGAVKVGDSVVYNLPLQATGNKSVIAHNLRFKNTDYTILKGRDTMLPGESGFLQFVYKPTVPFKTMVDTIFFTVISKGNDEIAIPLSLDVSAGIAGISTEKNAPVIYPNPVNDLLFIDMPWSANREIEIYNILGEKVLHAVMPANKISTGSLKKGIYILKIKTGEKVYSRKIIKQ